MKKLQLHQMKSLKSTTIFILSLLMFTFQSCNDEPLEGQFNTGGDGNGGGGGATTCVEATNNVSEATIAFGAVTPGDANYSAVCNDYLNALQDFLDLCGDTSGAIQALIDGLDCSSTTDNCPDAQAATDAAETAYNADPTNASLCNAYVNALENEITICGDSDGSLQDIIDGLSCSVDQDYWPRAIGNSWTYSNFTSDMETYSLIGTETLDGQEFYTFDNFLGVPTWIRKSGSSYFLRAEFSGEITGISFTSTPYTINMIKDDAIVGETWQSDVSYTISFDPISGLPDTDVEALYSFEMMERDISRTVEGVTYDEVIHIELVVTSPGQSATVQYYYANHVGMIDYITDDGTLTLLSYSLN